MSKFQNKTVFISGGTSGIGKATAEAFIAQGATVIITGRRQAPLEKTLTELGPNAHGLISDASKWDDLQVLKSKVEAIAPKLDVLFINAGNGNFAPIDQVDENHFDGMFNVLVKGAYFTVQKLLPLLGEGSAIIFNTSVVTDMGMPSTSVYSAAKRAVQSFTKTLAAELAPKGIRVNAVSPGPIQTNFFEATGMSQEQIEGFASNVLGQVPLGRFGSPDEIANAVVFLASSDASFVHGTELQVDGGMVQV